MIVINIVKFFYNKEGEYFFCHKVEYPDGDIIEQKDDKIDWSKVSKYIGNKYVIIFDRCIIEAGKIKAYYIDNENYEEDVGTIIFKNEIGDMNKYFCGVDNN